MIGLLEGWETVKYEPNNKALRMYMSFCLTDGGKHAGVQLNHEASITVAFKCNTNSMILNKHVLLIKTKKKLNNTHYKSRTLRVVQTDMLLNETINIIKEPLKLNHVISPPMNHQKNLNAKFIFKLNV